MSWAFVAVLILMISVVWQLMSLLDSPQDDVQAVVYRLIRMFSAFIGAMYLMVRL
jgi:hypothetical protein